MSFDKNYYMNHRINKEFRKQFGINIIECFTLLEEEYKAQAALIHKCNYWFVIYSITDIWYKVNEKIKKGGKLHYNDIFDATHWRPKAIEFPGPEPEVLDSSDDDIHLSDDEQELTL